MRNVWNKSCRETQKHMFNRFFFFCEIKWTKYGTAEQATDNNTAHALCMLDTYGYKHTHTEHAIFIDFPKQQLFREAPPYYAMRS
jgi:hypothetical protein